MVKRETVQHLTCHRGEYAGQQLIIARCGIGKVASALAVGVLVNAYRPDIVINTGSSGGYDKRLNVGDIVLPCAQQGTHIQKSLRQSRNSCNDSAIPASELHLIAQR